MRFGKKRKRFVYKLILASGLALLALLARHLARLITSFFPHDKFFSGDLVFVLSLAFVLALLFRHLDRMSFLLMRKLFQLRGRDSFRDLEALEKASESDLPLKELGNLMVNTLSDVLDMPTVSLLVLDRRHQCYYVVSSCGLKASEISKIRFTDANVIVRLSRQDEHPMVRDEIIMHFSWQEANVIANEFQQLHSAVVAPLFYEHEMVALCALSLKEKGKAYTREELNLLKDFGVRLGSPVGRAIHMHELTQMNDELKDYQSSLLQSSKLVAMEQLASGFAHQIHNPLTIISGKAQVLLLRKEKHHLSDEVVRVLASIVKETRRAADITQKLVAFSKLKKPVREPIDFAQIINDVRSLISYHASLDSIKVITHIQSDIPAFTATVAEFREVFLNLFMNGIDAMDGGGVLMVKVKYLSVSSEIEIKISDTGKGIPESELPQLFDPFFTTRHDRAGLGLFVVQKIVYRYKGTIRVESKEGQGTVFTIRFPVSGDAAPNSQEKDKQAHGVKGTTRGVHEYA